LFDRVPAKPVLFFSYAYLVRSGFRDGRPGFDYAVALAFYYWQITVKERELRRAASPDRAVARDGDATRATR
jgi:hypothetical protein